MYETRNETNRLSVTSGEETDPNDLIFRLLSGESSRSSRRQTKTEYELRIRRKSMSVTVAARSLFPARIRLAGRRLTLISAATRRTPPFQGMRWGGLRSARRTARSRQRS
jgi:hypothetical protein